MPSEGEQGLGGIPGVMGVPAGEATAAPPVTMVSYPKGDENGRNPTSSEVVDSKGPFAGDDRNSLCT